MKNTTTSEPLKAHVDEKKVEASQGMSNHKTTACSYISNPPKTPYIEDDDRRRITAKSNQQLPKNQVVAGKPNHQRIRSDTEQLDKIEKALNSAFEDIRSQSQSKK